MLTVQDLIDINKIPEESDISLKLLVDFYEQYLCKRIFIFKLMNGEVVKLFFSNAKELFHISGIDHIYEGIPMDGSRFLEGIKNDSINLATVKAININAYKDFELRIRSMACLDTVIKNCEYLFFPGGKIPDSNIEIKYLLLKGLDGKNIHLGIDTYAPRRPYFSKTLLITEKNQSKKFIDKADKRLRIASLQIKDKITDEILLNLERQKAIELADTEIHKISNDWISTYFLKTIVGELFNVSDENKQKIIKNGVNRNQRNIWKKELMNAISQEKNRIRTEVEKLDSYWAGKIVGEAIRKYEKEYAHKDIQDAFDLYIQELKS